MTDVCTAALLLTKPSSDDDWVHSWFRGRSSNSQCPQDFVGLLSLYGFQYPR